MTFAQDKLVALSFDDGPNTTTTVKMLDILKKHNVKASFFVIGNNIDKKSAKVMQRAYKEGHTIENHSLTHSAMPTLSADSMRAEIIATSALIEKYIGEKPLFFRPPYIALNRTLFDTIDLGIISGEGCNDWESNVSADTRIEKMLASARDGLIYLLHDFKDNDNTVEAVDRIIPILKERGFKFVTVRELFKAKNIAPQKGIIYTDILHATPWTQPTQSFDIDLWPNGLPNSNGVDKEPFDASKRNYKPSIRVSLPEKGKGNGKAILVVPGGGYRMLSLAQEGYDWAKEFVPQGIATIVLSYRMPNGNKEVPMSDATEAMRLIRENAEKWGINPQQVGILGSSAGGHLASTIATHNDPATRPNFQILFYPVISMDKSITHMDSHNCFVGEDATPEEEQLYSNHLQVKSDTPPAILLLADDDFLVPPANSAEYYLALKKAKVKASMHVYPSGGHGFGCGHRFRYHKEMMQDLQIWLDQLK